jgi:hypothetical protein
MKINRIMRKIIIKGRNDIDILPGLTAEALRRIEKTGLQHLL